MKKLIVEESEEAKKLRHLVKINSEGINELMSLVEIFISVFLKSRENEKKYLN